MPYIANVVNVMIASPTDVEHERKLVLREIHKWNAAHAKHRQIILNPLTWEENSVPLMGGPPQSLLNKQLCDEADLAVVIFHSRLGTPTANAASGTVDEINYLLEAGKQILLYKSTKPFPNNLDTEQLHKLKEYLTSIEHLGLRHDFESDDRLKDHLSRHLTEAILLSLNNQLVSQVTDQLEEKNSGPRLTHAAFWILKHTAIGNGTVYHRHYGQGLVIQAGGYRAQAEGPRQEAVIREAIQVLEDYRLIEYHSEYMHNITTKGFEVYDSIKDDEEVMALTSPFAGGG